MKRETSCCIFDRPTRSVKQFTEKEIIEKEKREKEAKEKGVEVANTDNSIPIQDAASVSLDNFASKEDFHDFDINAIAVRTAALTSNSHKDGGESQAAKVNTAGGNSGGRGGYSLKEYLSKLSAKR